MHPSHGLEVADNDGQLPLHYASLSTVTYESFTMMLQQYPAATQVRDAKGMAPLHFASTLVESLADRRILKTLLEHDEWSILRQVNDWSVLDLVLNEIFDQVYKVFVVAFLSNDLGLTELVVEFIWAFCPKPRHSERKQISDRKSLSRELLYKGLENSCQSPRNNNRY